jgi:hypothetical protein
MSEPSALTEDNAGCRGSRESCWLEGLEPTPALPGIIVTGRLHQRANDARKRAIDL